MTIAVAVIGAGGIGSRHARNVAAESDATVTAVCDVDGDRARSLAEEVDARSYTAPATLLAEESLDAVYVTTPPRERIDIVSDAAERDLALFVEKPLAATVADARAIVDVVERADVPCMVGFCSRFAEPCIRLKSLLEDGMLGDPVTLWTARAGWSVPNEGNWRVDPEQACGITIESASHNIDLLRWLGGEIEDAAGMTANVSHPELTDFDDNLVGVVSFTNGGIGSIRNSWTSHVRFLRHGIIGTEGAAYVEGDDWWRLDRLTSIVADESHARTITFDDETATAMGYRAETRAFLECVATDNAPPVDQRDGLRTVELSTALAQ